jgi:hypothetical protein
MPIEPPDCVLGIFSLIELDNADLPARSRLLIHGKVGAVDDAKRAGQVVEVPLAGALREIGHADPGLGGPQAPRADRGRTRVERHRPLDAEDAAAVDVPVEPADRLLRVLDLVELDDAGPRPGREGDALDDAERGEEAAEVGLAGALSGGC